MAFSAVIKKLTFSNVNVKEVRGIRSTTVNGFYVRLNFLLSFSRARRRYVCFLFRRQDFCHS